MTMSQLVLILYLSGQEYTSVIVNPRNFVLFFFYLPRNASHALAYFSVTFFMIIP